MRFARSGHQVSAVLSLCLFIDNYEQRCLSIIVELFRTFSMSASASFVYCFSGAPAPHVNFISCIVRVTHSMLMLAVW